MEWRVIRYLGYRNCIVIKKADERSYVVSDRVGYMREAEKIFPTKSAPRSLVLETNAI